MSAPPQGKLARLARLGGMAGRVAGSFAVGTLAALTKDEEGRKEATVKLAVAQAAKMVETMGALKGAAMKVGQSIAIAASVADLPDEVRAVLGKLHDDVEPVAWDTVRRTIEAQLDAPLTQLFARIDEAPLGTASLGQAHAACLPDGREVVVKVLHPGVEGTVDSDLAALRAILATVGTATRRKADLDGVFLEIGERLRDELDYLKEAANLEEFAQRFAGDPRVRIPRPVPSHSFQRVLTMERLRGKPLAEFVATGSRAAQERAGSTLGDLHHRMAFRFMALHADPHPGNYLFDDDGTISILDWGCVKRFDEGWIAAYGRTAHAAVMRDRDGTLQGARDAGVWVGEPGEEEDALFQFCLALSAPFREPRYRFEPDDETLMREIMKHGLRLKLARGIRVPRDLIYLHRSLAGLFSMMRELRAEDDWWAVVRPHLEFAIERART